MEGAEGQKKLFVVGAMLATVAEKKVTAEPPFNEAEVVHVEHEIDRMTAALPPLRNFILPGGHPAVSTGHVARTVCRRAERSVNRLNATEPVDQVTLAYLNRLSDYLFTLARYSAQQAGVAEPAWKRKNYTHRSVQKYGVFTPHPHLNS
jgi:cob(I)alamin adenosyltransferase